MQINALELAHRARVDGDIREGQELKSKYKKLSTEVKDITERGLQEKQKFELEIKLAVMWDLANKIHKSIIKLKGHPCERVTNKVALTREILISDLWVQLCQCMEMFASMGKLRKDALDKLKTLESAPNSNFYTGNDRSILANARPADA